MLNHSLLKNLSPSLLRYASVSERKQLERLLSISSPGMFARSASEGKWKTARHLDFLDRPITESIELADVGQRDGLLVALPPQTGKVPCAVNSCPLGISVRIQIVESS